MRERSRTGLFLLELVLMLLVFAVCAAVCMQVFAAARLESDRGRDLGNASLLAQSAAECWKSTRGDAQAAALLLDGALDQSAVILYRDDEWAACPADEAAFALTLTPQSSDGSYADISVEKLGEETPLFSLEVKAVVSHG